MKNNLTLFAREGKAKASQNTGGGASQCQTSRSKGAQQSTAQHDSARVFKYFNTQMARFLWNKKGEATVSEESCFWAQGRATSAEQPTNHALITHLSPTQTVSLARIWKYVACLLLVLFVGVGNVWGDTYVETHNGSSAGVLGMTTITTTSGSITYKSNSSAINVGKNTTASFTVSSNDGSKISSIVFTQNGSYAIGNIHSDDGNIAISSNTYTFTPTTQKTSYSFTVAAQEKTNCRITTVAITLSATNGEFFSKNFSVTGSKAPYTINSTKSNASTDVSLTVNNNSSLISSNALQLGNGKQFTIASSGHNITKVYFSCVSQGTMSNLSANTGSYSSNVWTADASTNTVTFSSSGSNANIEVIKVELASACSAPAAPTISSAGSKTAFTVGDEIALTATCASGTDASTIYTWYKGATWDAAKVTTPVQAASTSGATFTKTAALDDAATYWCEAANSTCKSHNTTGFAITVAPAPVANPVITGAVNEAGWGSVSPASITVTSGDAVSIDGAELTCSGKTLTATATTATVEYTYAFVNWTGVSNGDEITANTTATANFSRTANSYAVNYTAPTNGSYTIKVGDASAVSANTTAAYGTTVTLAATPASGYRLAGWTVAKAVGTVTVTNNQFTMPAEAVTVSAAFEEIPCPTSGTVYSADAITTSDVTFSTGTTEITSSQATVSGGTLYAVSGQADAKTFLTGDGRFSMKNNDTRFHCALDCALQAGDTIKIDGQGGTKSEVPKGLWVSTATSRPGSAPAAAGTNSTESWHSSLLLYVVTSSDEYVGKKDLYVYRAAGATQNFDNVRIIRPAKYAMTFAKGDEDASGTMDAQSVIEKSLVTLPTCTFTAPEGKEFDAWVVTKTTGGAAVSVTDGKFTMPQEAVTLTATWKALTVKYAVTYNLGGASGDAPTEANKAEGDVFDLAAAPTWSGHVFQGWQWTDNSSVTHLEDAAASFTMPAYAVTFTAQWKLDPNASMADAKYVIGGSALNMAAKYESSNTDSPVLFSLKEDSEDASITSAGLFTATVAGEYVVVAEQAGNATYAKGEAEATVEVLESELSDIYIWNKNSSHGGSGKCVTSDQANQDINANQASTTLAYSTLTMEGMSAMGRPGTAGDVTLTFAVKNAYSSIFAIASVCAYGKIEEPGGIEYSWDNTNWTAVDGGESDNNKHEFEAPAGVYPTNFYIRFTNAETGKGGLWLRNALVTLEAKKAIVSTVIDLTDVKINGTSISAANLATLKTGPAYALDLADEYVTAPTLKFNKHTVITYDDESVVAKDDIITETADVNLSGKWEASAEIDAITYTVTMVKADAFIVHYYESDGKTLISSENVALSGHPTAAGITPTPQDYKRVVWTRGGVAVDLEDVTSDVAGTEINLVASYVTAYASSINIEQWVLDNKVANKAGLIAELEGKGYKQVDLNALDSLNDDPSKTNRNYAFLGMKVNKATSAISFLLKSGSTVKARFGNMGNNVNVIIGEAEPVALTSGSYANSSVSSANEYSYTAEADVIVKFQSTDTKTVVFKQIMIDEAIASIKLPAVVTYDANGGTFGKTSEKYTGTPLVIGDATPASDEYEFEGWHVGTVEGAKINAAAYEPTANVTLVAKYVVKPSPFSLSALTFTIGAGEAQEVGYVEGTYEYDVELPYAGSYETITVAYTLAEGTSSVKSGAVLNVTSVPGAATFTVIAANETEKTYTVNFKKAAKDGLSIIKATISGGDQTAGFDAEGLYAGKGYAQTASKKLNTGGAFVGVQLKAGETFQAGDKLYVVTSTVADRGYIELYQEAAGTNLIKATGVRDASAGIALPSEAYGLNEIYIVRKTSEGDQSWNGTVNYVEVKRPMNPVLKSITFDGTKIDVAGTTVEETLPYATDLTAVTAEYYWNGAGTAVVTTNVGAWAWGDNTYVLTDKDGDATTYTITLVRATRSSDKSLSSLTVDGNAIELKEGVYDYTYEYPYGTDPATVPAVAAEANDTHASVGTITQAATTAGTASFTVTAEDETEQEYTVSFKISRVPGLVIYDGSTGATAFSATSYEDDDTHFAWSIGSSISVSADNAPASSTWGGKTYTKILKGFKPKNGNNEVSFTVPSGYLAKIRLVGSTNNDGDERKMFIAEEATIDASKAIGNYVITSSTYEAQGFVTELLMPGTYYLGSTDTYRLFEFSAQLYPIDKTRTGLAQGMLGTVCLPNGGIMVGASIFEIAYMDYEADGTTPHKIYFDEVIGGIMEAGMPYVILPNEGSSQFVVTYTDDANAEAKSKNGLVGYLGDQRALEENDYFIYNNMFYYVSSGDAASGRIRISSERAYINLSQVPGYHHESPKPAPVGRRRIAMSNANPAPQVATGMDEVQGNNIQSTKVMIDGQLFIIHGEKMYNATGILVK